MRKTTQETASTVQTHRVVVTLKEILAILGVPLVGDWHDFNLTCKQGFEPDSCWERVGLAPEGELCFTWQYTHQTEGEEEEQA